MNDVWCCFHMNGCNVNIILSVYVTKQTYFGWRGLNQLMQLELREQKSQRGGRWVGGAISPWAWAFGSHGTGKMGKSHCLPRSFRYNRHYARVTELSKTGCNGVSGV